MQVLKILRYIMTTQQVQLYPVRMVLCLHFNLCYMTEEKSKLLKLKDKKKELRILKHLHKKKIKPEIPKEKKKIEYKLCPPEGALRVGSYVNEKRLEIIKSYTRNENNECITNYESVSFVDSVLPSPSAALNVVTISLLAASSPLLLGLLKSISKTVFKKAITKKNKTNSE